VAAAAAPAGEVLAQSAAVAEQPPSPAVPEPVTETAPATVAPVASGSEAVAASMQEPIAAPALDADAPVELGVPKTSAPIADEPTPLGPPKRLPEGVDPELAEMMALAADLGEPAPSATGASLEEDFEQIMARKRKRRLILLVVLAVAAAYVAVTYVAVPRLFDLTAGKLVGIKLTVHPDAKPHVAKGVEIMYADTAAAYAEAIVQFEAALAVDPEYPRAVALAALAHVFRGSDVQERGREVYGEGSAAVAESKALEDLPRSRRTREVEKRITALHETAREKSDESSRLFEAGGEEVSAGYAMLQRGLEKYRDVPVVVEAAGIYYTTDRDAVRRAEECLRYAVETRYGPDQKLNLRDPPDVWAPFLQGLVHAQGRDKDGPNRAREAFEAVLETEPRFQRARYELIRVFDRTGAKAEARALAKEILAAVPEHEKAKRYLARSVEPSGLATAVPPAPAPPKPAKGKKRKKRRR
jgi:tetratricopeptide (TPR) repeat protein